MAMQEAFGGGEMSQAYVLHNRRGMELAMSGVLDQCFQAPGDESLGESRIHIN